MERVLSETAPVFIEGKPGDIVLFAPEIMHGSEENHSDIDCMYLMFIYNRSDNLPVASEVEREHLMPYVNYAYERISPNSPTTPLSPKAPHRSEVTSCPHSHLIPNVSL